MSRDFVYWLQGFFEIADPKEMTSAQVDMVKRHLALVFIHEIDPSAGDAKHQAELNSAHNQKPAFGVVGPGGTTFRC